MTYVKAQLQLEWFDVEDIITTSNTELDLGNNQGPTSSNTAD